MVAGSDGDSDGHTTTISGNRTHIAVGDDDTQTPRSKRARGHDTMEIARSVSKLSPLELMQLKDSLKENLQKAADSTTARVSPLGE